MKTDWQDVARQCEIVQRDLADWTITLYESATNLPSRAILVRPDYRVQIGRSAETLNLALSEAIIAARNVEKQ